MRTLCVVVVLGAIAPAVSCGGHPPIPNRLVVENDLGSWKFRRFQGPLLDVEVWVDGNKAEAYSASYITADAEKRGRIEDKDLVNVFVTRYETSDGVVRATVKLARRLAQDGGYQVEEDKIAGARTLTIVGRGEAWVMWPSNKHVVKVGGRGRSDVPTSMVENYVDRYPSQLPGGALEGALPPGPDGAPERSKQIEKPAYDADNPRPDIDRYDPEKVKLPDQAKTEATEANTEASGEIKGEAKGVDAAEDKPDAKDAGDAKPAKPAKKKKKPARSRK